MNSRLSSSLYSEKTPREQTNDNTRDNNYNKKQTNYREPTFVST